MDSERKWQKKIQQHIVEFF